jgi:hypothetical protein
MTSSTFDPAFYPAWWLPDGHSQTVWRKFKLQPKLQQNRQRIELEDGDFLDLDWVNQSALADDKTKPIVFIVHGLCGCSKSEYILSLQQLLTASGYASVALNFRGCSGEINRLAKAYHSGITEDLDEAFQNLAALHPDRKFAFVGYSLGANVLLKWLGEIKGKDSVTKAVAVSTPFSLAYCSRSMLRGLTQAYGKFFLRKLVRDVKKKQAYFEAIGNTRQLEKITSLGGLDNISTIWEFDDRVTAPLHGFKDAEDYYEQCSSIGYMKNIATETLLIQSRNDPLIPSSSLPDIDSLAGNFHLQLSDNGGHVGFVAAKQKQWLEHRIVDFLKS